MDVITTNVDFLGIFDPKFITIAINKANVVDDTQLEINFDAISEKEKILKLKLEEAKKKLNTLSIYTNVLEANNKRLDEEVKSLKEDNKKLKDIFDYYYSKYLSMKKSIENIRNYLNT